MPDSYYVISRMICVPRNSSAPKLLEDEKIHVTENRGYSIDTFDNLIDSARDILPDCLALLPYDELTVTYFLEEVTEDEHGDLELTSQLDIHTFSLLRDPDMHNLYIDFDE